MEKRQGWVIQFRLNDETFHRKWWVLCLDKGRHVQIQDSILCAGHELPDRFFVLFL